MNAKDYFEIGEEVSFWRPQGELNVQKTAELVTAAIAHARELGVRKLLLDVRNLTGHHLPNISTRYLHIQEWARAAGGAVQVAIVPRREMIDPERFGVEAALNAGFTCDVFATEEEGLAWLRAQKY